MFKFWPLLLSVSLQAQTNLFRLFPQSQPPSHASYQQVKISPIIKTADGGFIFSCNPFSPGTPQPFPVDYITVKTNQGFVPQWKRGDYARLLSLPSGGIISVNLARKDKAIIEKRSLSGQLIWSKEIVAPVPPPVIHTPYTQLNDAVAYNDKFRILGSAYTADASGTLYSLFPFSAELDTTTGTVVSAARFNITNVVGEGFNTISRDAQGTFYFTGTSRTGLARFSASFTFMWQLSWFSLTNAPQVTGLKFLPGGDVFCSMLYKDTLTGDYNPGIMKVTNPATVVFEKRFTNLLGFSGMDNMPGSNVLFSFIRKLTQADTLKAHLMALDNNGALIWCRALHACVAVSAPLSLGNGEYLLYSYNPKTTSLTAQNPALFTVDQFGQSTCGTKPVAINLQTVASSPTLNTISLVPVTLTLSPILVISPVAQLKRDTCGGLALGQGWGEMASERITLYPNPAGNTVKIEFQTQNEEAEIVIYNASGQKVAGTLLQHAELDVSQLENGLYYLEIRDKTQQPVRQKLLISHREQE